MCMFTLSSALYFPLNSYLFLSKIPYKKIELKPVELPPLPDSKAYVRPPMDYQTFVPEKF